MVEQLTAHPGTKYVGLSMLEKAANESQIKGNQGRLVLSPMLGRAEKFYQDTGFTAAKMDRGMVTQMKLDPSQSDKWESDNSNRWRLKRARANNVCSAGRTGLSAGRHIAAATCEVLLSRARNCAVWASG